MQYINTQTINTPISSTNMPPLHFATRQGSYNVVEQLIQFAKNNNMIETVINKNIQRFETPLHIAAKQNHHEIAELLINNNADVNVKNKKVTVEVKGLSGMIIK